MTATRLFPGRKAAWLVLLVITAIAICGCRRAGMAHSTVRAANRAWRGNLVCVASVVAVDNAALIGVCGVPCGAALAEFALVEESGSRNRFHPSTGLDLVREAESFRMDV